MKILKLILIGSVIFLFTGCAFTGDEVTLEYIEPPEIEVQSGQFLIAPFVTQTLDRLSEETAARIFTQYCETRENTELVFLSYEHYPSDIVQKTITSIINSEDVDSTYFVAENIDFIITGTVWYETRFFADNITSDKMSPAYSAEYSGYPGFWETSEEWRRRSFENLIFEVRTELFVWHVATKKTVFKKKYSQYFILEEYREKNVKDERDNAYQLLLQENARLFLSAFQSGVKQVKRMYIR